MDSIIKYLREGELPSERVEAKKVQKRVAHYILREGKLYTRSYSMPLLKCLTNDEENYVMRGIHEGVCGNHFGARSLCYKIVR